MKITVIGTGYVGLIAGLGFAKWGNEVVCLDVVPEKIEKLQNGVCPIYEPGAETQLIDGLASGRLRFTCDAKEAVEHGELIFIAVGTPEAPDGSADLKYVYSAVDEIVDYMQSYKLVVDKSTVPVGTARALRERMAARLRAMEKDIPFDVASNPEFLREGRAVGDFNNPDRIVLGVASERAEKLLREIYKVFSRSNKPVIVTTPETAEMIKYASNAFLATKITFINEIANLCEQVGANALEVAAAMGKDGRISPKFLHPGPGYGGSCFPKDTKAIADTGVKYGSPMTIVESVIRANQLQKELAAKKVMDRFPEGGTIALLGLSFKPETDDIRESPAIDIARMLLSDGRYTVQMFDPRAMENSREALGDPANAVWCRSAQEALVGADTVVIATEWPEFSALDLDGLKSVLRCSVMFDLRNIYHKDEVEAAGIEYHGTGV
jgi:nucleotide sugar dehydrogenase